MIRYFFIFLALMLTHSYVTQAQLIIKNDKSKSEDSLILYAGIDNRLEIYLHGSATDTQLFKKIVFRKGDYDLRNINYNGNALFAVVNVYTLKNIKLKLTIQGKDTLVNGYVRAMPDMFASLNRYCDTIMSKEKLQSYLGLSVFFKDVNFKMRSVVRSFDFKTIINGDSIIINNQGPYFDKKIKESFSKLKSGTVVCFSRIVISCPNGRNRLVKDFIVKVI